MDITTFDELLTAARQQPDPQRLLMVFAGAAPGDSPTPEQRSAFVDGHGGELTPLICVDKSPDEITNFAAIVEESKDAGPPWAIVFVAALSGPDGSVLDSRAAERPLQRMVDGIRTGALTGMIPFDRTGRAVKLE